MTSETTSAQRKKQEAITEPILPALTSSKASSEPAAKWEIANPDMAMVGKPPYPRVEMPPLYDVMHPPAATFGLENGSKLRSLWFSLRRWFRRTILRKRVLGKVDPINSTTHKFTDTEYVSRWGLVEFGVFCPRCEAMAAGPGQFRRILETDEDGEAVICPECKCALLASPTTEKEEHKLPYTAELHTFARRRHKESPHTSKEAAEIRAARRMKEDPFAAIEKEPANG